MDEGHPEAAESDGRTTTSDDHHLAAAGLTLIMLAFLAFVSTLVLHAIAAYAPDGAGEED